MVLGAFLWMWMGWHNSPYAVAGKDLPATLAKAKQLGLPLSASEMPARTKVKPEDNAAPILRETAKIVVLMYGNTDFMDIVPRRHRHFWQGDPQFSYASILKQTLLASRKPSCDFEIDWDAVPWELPVRQVDAMRAMVLLLCEQGHHAIQEGDFKKALKYIDDAYHLGEMLSETPLVMTVQAGLTSQIQTCSVVNRLIIVSAQDAVKLRQIRSHLEKWTNTIDVKPIIRGEFYYTLALGRNVSGYAAFEGIQDRRGLKLSHPSRIERSGEPRGLLVRGMVAKYLNALIHIEEKRLTHPNGLELHSYLLNGWRKDANAVKKTTPWDERAYHKFDMLQWNSMEADANRECLKALISALLFKIEKGRLPKDLAELGPVATDPFDQKPLKMVLRNGVLRVYSVGVDGKDNGGSLISEVKNPSMTSPRYDLVASCPIE
jgi:hypothetical protein